VQWCDIEMGVMVVVVVGGNGVVSSY